MTNISFNTNYRKNSAYNISYGDNSSAVLTKPIQATQDTIENGTATIIDTFETERKKKSSKIAIAVGSGVLVITTLVGLLNPKTSAKTLQKLKLKRENIRAKIKLSKTGTWKNKWYKFSEKLLDIKEKMIDICNDFNNGKDILWKRLCCNEKEIYKKIDNKFIRNILQGIDKGFIFLMKKPHEIITNWFDTFTKNAVKSKYKTSIKETNKIDALIDRYKDKYKDKISTEDLKILDDTLAKIKDEKQYLSGENVEKRLAQQGNCMQDLENAVVKDFVDYGHEVSQKGISLKERLKHAINDLHFFSEKQLESQKERIEAEGLQEINKFTGMNETQKGLYDNVYDILSKYLENNEKKAIQNQKQKVYNALQKANKTECTEYFDKKRDLVLGSAPTDVVTAVTGLGLAGLAVGKSDTKNERINRAIAVGGPAVIGVGTSLYLTSRLFSGFKNMVLSGVIGFIVSKTGSLIANKITGEKDEIIEDGKQFFLADMTK